MAEVVRCSECGVRTPGSTQCEDCFFHGTWHDREPSAFCGRCRVVQWRAWFEGVSIAVRLARLAIRHPSRRTKKGTGEGAKYAEPSSTPPKP
jgi:hypothetical protein